MTLVYAPGNTQMIKVALARSISCLLPIHFSFKLMGCRHESTT
jgi:hypothetical protein